jgi:hypothetical protein
MLKRLAGAGMLEITNLVGMFTLGCATVGAFT